MTCPVCGGATRVTEVLEESDAVYRLRKCRACKRGFFTEEKETTAATEIQIAQKREQFVKKA